MDQATLVKEATELINSAVTAQGTDQPEVARRHLAKLRDLLFDELPPDAPAEPEAPPTPEQTPES